ncbi:MAG: class I SAM-dependent methyltransferase [Vicinamibacterales bacterium]
MRRHYSYSIYADPETAARFDERRFGGPIGSLLAETQERVLMEFLEPFRTGRLLDVGTGTGRAAIALARSGADVVAIDYSATMLGVARERAAREGVRASFMIGDAHALAFPDRAFDAAISLRVLMHAPDWRRCLAELCRVSAKSVIFDYPACLSVAALQAAYRRAAAHAGRRVEAYRVLTDRSVDRALADNGFVRRRAHRQFVLPVAAHKALGSPAFSTRLEAALARAGLLALFGSPVTVAAERCRY